MDLIRSYEKIEVRISSQTDDMTITTISGDAFIAFRPIDVDKSIYLYYPGGVNEDVILADWSSNSGWPGVESDTPMLGTMTFVPAGSVIKLKELTAQSGDDADFDMYVFYVNAPYRTRILTL